MKKPFHLPQGARRRLLLFSCVIAVMVLLPTSVAAQALPRPDHVVIVIEENKSFQQIIGKPEAPYINSLVSRGALLTSFFALRHPSQSNYILLFSGDRQGVKGDECLSGHPLFTAPSLGGELIKKGLSFKGYSETIPKVGSTVCTSGKYARKHSPWINFADVPPQVSLPFSDFPSDFEKLPTLAIVIPNLDNDMHDGSILTGDKWLKKKLDSYAKWAESHNSLLIVTWDEDNNHCDFFQPCDTKPPKNRIATILVGEMIKQGLYDKKYTHLDLLRTLEDMYELPRLGASKNAKVITDVWK